jgi:hydroxymethylpyrimidine kinase/phosphomethylpyrimidine kinase
MLLAQFDALAEDLPPTALKSGMLWDAATIDTLAAFLRQRSAPRPIYLCDPVLLSTSGQALIQPDAVAALKDGLFPLTDLLTPNLPEARALTGLATAGPEVLAEALRTLGCRSVLIKGGHTDEGHCTDFWSDGNEHLYLSTPRIPTESTHGTGCSLSAAITAFAASGSPLKEAVIQAKSYITQSIRNAPGLGGGHGPLDFAPWQNDPKDQPSLHT